jgi:mRNA-degrading endonuclease RelE of RelBE toxin-antitoxin system
MIYKTVATPDFERELKRLSRKHASLAKDFAGFLDSIEREPQQGTPLGNNCYEIRLAIISKGRGKSSGARIITYVKIVKETVYLISIYDKSEQQTISDSEITTRIKGIPD